MQATIIETVPPHRRVVARTSNPNGRPPFKPREGLCNQVELLASIGLAHHKIAKSLRISPTTLRKHFRLQLKWGAAQAKANVPTPHFDRATNGRDVSAAIFFAKTCGGFRTDSRTEPSNRVKNPSPRHPNQGGF